MPVLAGGAFVVLAVVVTAFLGMRYHGVPMAGRFDGAVDTWVIHTLADHRPVATAVSVLGTVEVVGALAVVAAVVLAWLHRSRRAASLVVLAPLLTTIVAEWLMKPWVGRTLEGDLSFPSGHTSRATALAVALIIGARWIGLGRRMVGVVAALGLVAVVAVAWSMVAAGYHYATDTMAGMLVGGAVALLSAGVVELVAARLKAARRPL